MNALFLHDAAQLLTLAGLPVPRRGRDLGHLGIIRSGSLLAYNGTIIRVGRTRDLLPQARRLKARPIDCRGCVVMPGFVDAHTHLVFAGNRVADFEQRIQGKTYAEIAAAGGGIRLSARLLRAASKTQLVGQALGFLTQLAAHGTTTVEVKTGYGLDIRNELKMLAVIRQLRKRSSLEIAPTLLAAHAVPPEYANRPARYVRQVCRHLIPPAARHAEFIDCFCDRGAFTVAQCRQILQAGVRRGLVPRLHAEQMAHTGAARLAVEMNAASADHLDHVHGRDIRALARSTVVATLLPGVNFFLGLNRYPPARRLIDAGAAVALATDFNPGSCPTLNMQLVLSLAATAMRLSPAEAISAATINPAYALRRHYRLGSLEPGKQADVAVMEVSDYREIPYYFGWNHCRWTIKRGQVIYPVGDR